MYLNRLKKLVVILTILLFSGCTLLTPSIKTGEDDSVLILGYNIMEYPSVKNPMATIYLVNVKSKEEIKIELFEWGLFNKYKNQSLAINLKPGEYELRNWEYSFCRSMKKDEKGYPLYCQDNVSLKGVNSEFKNNRFVIKKGDILYLGHIYFDVANAILYFSNKRQVDIQNFHHKYSVDLEGRAFRNLSSQLGMDEWRFEMTGYRSMFEKLFK